MLNNCFLSDLDECKDASQSGCSHQCENAPGTFVCRCEQGYELGSDEKTCQGQYAQGWSPPMVAELPSQEKWLRCLAALVWHQKNSDLWSSKSGKQATDECWFFVPDEDECKEPMKSGCSQLCQNTPGSFSCNCHDGYRLSSDSKTCIRKWARSIHFRVFQRCLIYQIRDHWIQVKGDQFSSFHEGKTRWVYMLLVWVSTRSVAVDTVNWPCLALEVSTNCAWDPALGDISSSGFSSLSSSMRNQVRCRRLNLNQFTCMILVKTSSRSIFCPLHSW